MIEAFLEYTESFLVPLGASGLFLAAFLEEIIAPIPSAAVMMTAGFFFLSGEWSSELLWTLIFTISIPIALGVTLGSSVIFAAAYAAGQPVIEKWGRWFGISWKDVERFQGSFGKGKRDEAVIFAARALPIIPSVVVSAVCGLIRYDIKKYLVITFFAGLLRVALLALLGWQLGNVYEVFAERINQIEDAVLVLLIGSAAVALLGRLYVHVAKKRSSRKL